ncbi:MAG: EthD domain-containing protein [Myxococcota bacterium]
MIKLTFALRRLPHLSRDEFQDYWREQHAPLVEKHREALGIRRYVQCHTLTVPANDALRGSRGAPPEYDGVAELWFDDAELRVTDEAREAGLALLEDERRFIDLENSPLWLSEEKPIFGD